MKCAGCKSREADYEVEQFVNFRRVPNPTFIPYCQSCMALSINIDKELEKLGIRSLNYIIKKINPLAPANLQFKDVTKSLPAEGTVCWVKCVIGRMHYTYLSLYKDGEWQSLAESMEAGDFSFSHVVGYVEAD